MGRKVCVRAHCSEFRTVNSEHYRIRKLKIPKRRRREKRPPPGEEGVCARPLFRVQNSEQ